MASVGFQPDRTITKKLTQVDYIVAGSLSAVGTRATCQPLDVLKIRFQLQVESKKEAKYKSILHASRVIWKEEGLRGFWRGHVPAQNLSIAYGGIQFYSFEYMTKLFYTLAPWTTDNNYKFPVHFVIGSLSGLAGTFCSYPFDVVRTRLVAQGAENKVYCGSIDAVKKMWQVEGFRSFFKGIVPCFATIGPYSGLQFAFYKLFTNILDPVITKYSPELGDKKITMSGSMGCGAMAGLFAKIVVFPFDTTKKRLQILGFHEGRAGMGRTETYSGMLDCLRQIVQREGLTGLFKGLTPGLIKAVSTTSINFWLYEMAILFIALRHKRKNEEDK